MAAEIEGLQRSGEARLSDAANVDLSLESRFDLAYNAAHALALAALRRFGYRSANRYIVFPALAHTLGLPPAIWRVLAKGHESRNVVTARRRHALLRASVTPPRIRSMPTSMGIVIGSCSTRAPAIAATAG